MATLRDIRQRIVSVKSTAKITAAMKMVAAAKMKRAQGSIESARPYFSKLENMVAGLLEQASEKYEHPLSKKRDAVNNIAIILVSSDRGLCGSFNTNLFKSLANEIKSNISVNFPDASIQLLPIGKKAIAFAKKNKFDIIAEFPGIFSDLNFSYARDIVENVLWKFLEGQIDRIFVFYNEYVSIVRSIPNLKLLLPLQSVAPDDDYSTKVDILDYIYEPSQADILDVLIPKLVNIIVWRALLDSNAAEQSARMLAMEKATTNAKELTRNLELQYNKARQAAITTEMLEIVSGAEALYSA